MASRFIKRWKGKAKAKLSEPYATQQVLNTYELLEPILLYLSPPELRQAKFVSKAWNEVITRSPPLNSAWQTCEQKRMERIHMVLFGDSGVGKRTLYKKASNHLEKVERVT